LGFGWAQFLLPAAGLGRAKIYAIPHPPYFCPQGFSRSLISGVILLLARRITATSYQQ